MQFLNDACWQLNILNWFVPLKQSTPAGCGQKWGADGLVPALMDTAFCGDEPSPPRVRPFRNGLLPRFETKAVAEAGEENTRSDLTTR
jgi:hypothetical protein